MNKSKKETRLQIAYRLGFNAAGEGWNGEYPFDHSATEMLASKHWLNSRNQVLKSMVPKKRRKK